MVIKDNNKSQKIANKYVCVICDYNTINKYDYNKHFQTVKHKDNDIGNNGNTESHKCDCGKVYSFLSGLSRHKKRCVVITKEIEQTNPIISQEIVMEILKQNDDLKNLLVEQTNKMLELCKNGINNTNNTNCI